MLKNPAFIPTLVGALLVTSIAVGRADGNRPQPSGELYNIESPEYGDIKSDNGVETSIVDHKGAKAIKVDVTKLDGYPGVNFPVPSGGWDLSGFAGAKIKVTNPGTENLTVNLKAENAGDWKVSPWSVDMVSLAPGETKTLRVVFGEAFHHPAYALDRSHITGLRLFLNAPKNPASFVIGKPVVFKAGEQTTEELPEPTVETPTPTPEPKPVAKAPPVFPPTPLVDIAGKHDFPAEPPINDEAAEQLKGLCSVSEFRALPEKDRHVYSFDVWPGNNDSLDVGSYPFNFHLGTEGVTSQKVAFLPEGKENKLTRTKDAAANRYTLGGFGRLDWGANGVHVFKFNKPVIAFGVVVRSSGDFGLQRFFWGSNPNNGYPVSYTLADGTVVQLGEREKRAATIKGNTDAFIGVIDRTGRGIVSVTYTIKGLGGNVAQSINLVDLAFATRPQPAVASLINLRSSCDFENPDAIAATPSPAAEGMASLDDFRFIVGNHRYVYSFGTWPQAKPDLGSNTGSFSFDLNGKGEAGQDLTIKATNAADNAKLTQTMLKSEDGQPYAALGGLGDVGKGAWAEQTFEFKKPVWGFGVTYRSPGDLKLASPVSYTLSDGTKVQVEGSAGGTLSGKTFVGLIDKTDKGISSVTVRVQGTATGAQPVYIEEVAFALAGPPPGNWKLTMADEFDGDKLNPAIWTTGYTFPDVINNEMQAFVPENVTVANGVCTIKVEIKDGVNTDRTGRHGAAKHFTSGAFTSFDKFTQTYGYFEARIKMPKARGAGIWPAFWMLPDRGADYGKKHRGSYRTKDYGMGSEIDIFEFMPWWKTLDGRFRIHCGTIWSYGKVTPEDPAPHGYGAYALANDGWGPEELTYPNADTEFHTYGLYWSPERLIFYLDSKPIFRVKDPKNVPDVAEYFLFNISITGNGWGASPDKKHPTLQQIVNDMPNKMEIDYFRAYSGTLDEAVPAAPTDLPVIRQYPLPPKDAAEPEKAAPSTATPTPAQNAVPSAPVNSTITSPSNG
ncbi:hypothetical protein BH09VER1_BH09VER1_27970 [soil metagenome]